MTDECPVNCAENPDAVDKINWKCVYCKRDLKPDFDKVIAERKAKADAEEVEFKKKNAGTLTETEIADRRSMAE